MGRPHASLEIRFKFACCLLRRPLQIERAHEFSALVHEIDDSSMIHRIVTGFSARHFFGIYAKGFRDGLDFLVIASQPDDAGIEAFKIGLQNIRRVALGIDGDEKARRPFCPPPSP